MRANAPIVNVKETQKRIQDGIFMVERRKCDSRIAISEIHARIHAFV